MSSVSCPGISSSEGGPLFMYQDGQYLTRQRLVAEVRDALERAGLDQSRYCGHSFRIGTATMAAERCYNKNTGAMEESSLHGLHQDSTGAVGQLLRKTMLD